MTPEGCLLRAVTRGRGAGVSAEEPERYARFRREFVAAWKEAV